MLYLFPCSIRVDYWTWFEITFSSVLEIPVTQWHWIHGRSECIVSSSSLVTKQSPRHTQLQVRQYILCLFHERLTHNVPSQRNRREESPAVTLGKTWRAVVTSVYFYQVTSHEIVIDTAEVSACSPCITSIFHSTVTACHFKARIAGRQDICYRIVQISVFVIFFLITQHRCKVMFVSKREWIISIQVDRLILVVHVVTGIRVACSICNFRTCTYIIWVAGSIRNLRKYLQCPIIACIITISIIEEDMPVFQRFQFQSASHGQVIVFSIGFRTALQVWNHWQFCKVAIRIDYTYCRTETCQWVIETFT